MIIMIAIFVHITVNIIAIIFTEVMTIRFIAIVVTDDNDLTITAF